MEPCFGDLTWSPRDYLKKKLFSFQKRAVGLLFSLKNRDTRRALFRKLGILTLTSILQSAKYAKKILPLYSNSQVHKYNTRFRNDFRRKNVSHPLPSQRISRIYNKFPQRLKETSDIKTFAKHLERWLLDKEYYSIKNLLDDWCRARATYECDCIQCTVTGNL